ncbi:replication/maintenance protein RepL [Streptococcus pluranimalium]
MSKEKNTKSLDKHVKAETAIVKKQSALTEKDVVVTTREVARRDAFLRAYYDMLAVSLNYEAKGSGAVLRYLQNNAMKETNLVITTIKDIAKEADTSSVWIQRTINHLVQDEYLENLGKGIWKVSNEFLKLAKEPAEQAQIVFDFVQVAEQLEAIDEDGNVSAEMTDEEVEINLDDISK